MPVIIEGVNPVSLSSVKSEKPVWTTLTVYQSGVVSVEKTTGQKKILRGPVQGMNYVSYANIDENWPYEVLEFYLDDNCIETLACKKGTYDRLKTELFRM